MLNEIDAILIKAGFRETSIKDHFAVPVKWTAKQKDEMGLFYDIDTYVFVYPMSRATCLQCLAYYLENLA